MEKEKILRKKIIRVYRSSIHCLQRKWCLAEKISHVTSVLLFVIANNRENNVKTYHLLSLLFSSNILSRQCIFIKSKT